MNETRDHSLPVVHSILHPTDFSTGSRAAFHHALKAALLAKSKLTLMHLATSTDAEWADFPGVRETLERWQLLPKGSRRSDLPRLGVEVRKVVAEEGDPVGAVLGYMSDHPADLIVLATHQHEGRVRWLQQSVAEPIARRAGQITLVIPGDSAGFVAAADGTVSLRNILIPIAATPGPQGAVEAAARLVGRLNSPRGTFTLLHVGEPDAMPQVQCPEMPGWDWKRLAQAGDVIPTILDTASKTKADLIVMTTEGRNGFLDALRGSHSERLLRHSPVPLLVVPVDSNIGSFLA